MILAIHRIHPKNMGDRNTLFPTDWQLSTRLEQGSVPNLSIVPKISIVSTHDEPLVVKDKPEPPAGKFVMKAIRYIEIWLDISNEKNCNLFAKYKVKEIRCDKHDSNFNPDKACKTCNAKQNQGSVWSVGKGNSERFSLNGRKLYQKHVIDIPERSAITTLKTPEGWSFKTDGKTICLTIGNMAKNKMFKQRIGIIELFLGIKKIADITNESIGIISEKNENTIVAIFNRSIYENVCPLYKEIAMTGFRILLTKQPDYFEKFVESPFHSLQFANPEAHTESCDPINILCEFVNAVTHIDIDFKCDGIDLEHYCNNITVKYFM